MGEEYGFDVREAVAGAFSWVTYAVTRFAVHDEDLADKAKDFISDIAGTVSSSDKNSISGKTAELCKKAWNNVLKKHNAFTFKDLPEYNFAADPFHWDDLQTIENRIKKSRGKNRISIWPVAPDVLAKDVILELGKLMDDDQALRALVNQQRISARLDELSMRAGSKSESTKLTVISTEGTFSLGHYFKFFGREKETRDILAALKTEKMIIVHGEGGIGKTELCREVIGKSGMKSVPVKLIGCRTYWDFLVRIAGVLGIGTNADTTENQLVGAVFAHLNTAEKTILYLDNFEDVISEANTAKKDRNCVYDFLRHCISLDELTILISSREIPERGIAFWPFSVGVLDEGNAVKLFMNQWEGKGSDEDIKAFVIRELHCYPLSILLCAKQGQYYSLEKIREKWRSAKIRVSNMQNDRHESIQTALLMTYEEIKDMAEARKLWGLFTLFPDMIEEQVAETVIEDYDEGMKKLVNLTVLHRVEGDIPNHMMLAIQPTLREYIEGTELYREDMEGVSESLKKYYVSLFNVDRVKEGGTDNDRKAVNSLQNVLFFMDYLREQKRAEEFGQLHRFVRDYYEGDPYAALEVLKRAVKELDYEDGSFIIANLKKCCGDLEMRMDKIMEAEIHYCEAEKVFRDIHEDLGLANVLLMLGNLKMWTARPSEAEGHYREAEMLYRRTKDDLGLANILKVEGELEMRANKLSKAEGHFREAESLCRRIKYKLGLANVLLAEGTLEMRRGNFLAAEKYYCEAKLLYQCMHHELGVANAQRSAGDLLQIRKNYEEAVPKYEEAILIYEKVQDLVGASYSYAELCFCSAKIGDFNKMEDCQKKMSLLLAKIPYDTVKNYCEKKVREAREILGMST